MKTFLAFTFALWALSAFGAQVSVTNTVNWTPGITVGVHGGIPTYRTNLIDVTASPYNADKTGATSASAAIQSAVDASGSNDVVYLPAGTYRFTGTVRLKSYMTVRGAGTNTLVDHRGSAVEAFAIGSGSDYQWNVPGSPDNAIVSGYTKGSSNLVFASTGSWVGKLCMLKESNDSSLPVLHTMGYEKLRKQISYITAVNGTTITIWPPLYWTMQSGLSPTFAVANGITELAGLEDLSISGTNLPSTAPLATITQGHNCWFKGVKASGVHNWAFWITDSARCEMRQCWANKSLDGPVSNHAGLLADEMAACLIEDNIFDSIFPLIEVNRGSCGNVFSYNFGNQDYWGAGFDANHNPHNHYNLWEGNIVANFQSDGYFGSDSDDTLFRNWFYEELPYGTPYEIWGLKLCRLSRNYAVLGNVLGTSRTNTSAYGHYEIGFPNMGNEGWTGFGPPWSLAVRDSGAVTFSQSGTTITASAPFFGATNVGWLIQDRTDGTLLIIAGYTSSTVVSTTDAASRTAHSFGLAPGAGGYQEMDTNVQSSAWIGGNYAYPVTVRSPSSQWPTNDPNTSLTSGDYFTTSLIYNSAPSWWGTNRWPAIDPTNTVPVAPIPAQLRYSGIDSGTNSGTAPSITVQPQNATVTAPATASFSVTATGDAPLAYQWTRAGTNVTGATASSYTTPATATGDSGQVFTVTVTNASGSVTSGDATLTVNAPSLAVGSVTTLNVGTLRISHP